jgi:enamine deaminase RidA (YjgF/YER057c/UK114 family)
MNPQKPHRHAVGLKEFQADRQFGISPAVQAGPLLFISGQVATDHRGELTHRGNAREQARLIFERIQKIVEEAGGTMNDIVDNLASLVDIRDVDAVLEVAQQFFDRDFPAWTFMGTQGLRQRGALLQIHAVAHLGDEKKECFLPDSLRWWKAKPVSGACRKGPYLFISGQLPIDMDGNVVNPGDHTGQARYLFNRMKDLVELAGGKLEDDALDLISFSVDPRSFGPMCDVKNREFLTMPFSQAPCSSILASTGLYRHLAHHTVRLICEIGNGKAVAFTPPSLFWRYLPVSGGTKKEHGHLLCIAGEVSMDMDGQIVSSGDPVKQARYAFNRIREVVSLAGGTMDNVVDIISFHKDPRAIESTMEVARDYFKEPGPAWTAMGYTGGYFEGHLHEICARAWLP